jgi:hypothetical protein
MSRILIIEPYKLLQHGFAGALFAEHELTVFATIPETAEGADVAIIDAAALRERESLSRLEMGRIRTWQLPIVWLDADEQAEAPATNNITRAKLPINKESLKQIVVAVQSSSGVPALPAGAETNRADGSARRKPRVRQAKASDAAGESGQAVIELVDVVEEIAADDGGGLESLRKE